MKLRVVLRTDSAGNKFVRLSPATARELYDEAVDAATAEVHTKLDASKGWNVLEEPDSSDCQSGVGFLPLKITFSSSSSDNNSQPSIVVYASYNGGDAVTGTNEAEAADVISLPPSLVPSGVTVNIVDVTALVHVQDAQILHVEASTSLDYTLLQQKAEWLESGALLQQLSLVYEEQLLSLDVGNLGEATIKVSSRNFTTDDSPWPTNGLNDSNKCLRLVAQTQIVVAPPSDSLAPSNGEKTVNLKIMPTRDDYTEAMHILAKEMEVLLPRVDVCMAFINKATLATIAPYDTTSVEKDGIFGLVTTMRTNNNSKHDDELQHSSISVQLQQSDSVPEGYIALHPLHRLQLHLEPCRDSISLRCITKVQIDRLASSCNNKLKTDPPSLSCNIRHVKFVHAYHCQPYNLPAILTARHLSARHQLDRMSQYVQGETKNIVVSNNTLLPLSYVSNHQQNMDYFQVTIGSENHDDEGNSPLLYRKDLDELLSADTALDTDDTQSSDADSGTTIELPISRFIVDTLPYPHVSLPTSILPVLLDTFDYVITGPKGGGKTHAALEFASRLRLQFHVTTLYLDCKQLKETPGMRMKELLSRIDELFIDVKQCDNTVLILDNVDEIAPHYASDDSFDESTKSENVDPVAADQARLVSCYVQNLIGRHRSKVQSLQIIITCQDTLNVDQSLLESLRYVFPVALPVVESEYKSRLFSCHLKASLGTLVNDSVLRQSTMNIARLTEGYRPFDYVRLAHKVAERLGTASNSGVDMIQTINDCLADNVPLSKMKNTTISKAADVTWNMIGGLFQTKERLQSVIVKPMKYRKIYAKSKVSISKGVLLYGPPGCGKSYIVPALAKYCNCEIVTCRGPELLDRYIGASEAKVRELFALAKDMAPCILFLDELDSIAPRRGSEGVTDRIVNQLLTFLDGVEDLSNVYIVGTTSRPDRIDPALLRPGRLDQHLHVGLPESTDEWIDIVNVTSQRYDIDADTRRAITTGELVTNCQKELSLGNSILQLSPADIKAVFDAAQIYSVRDAITSAQQESAPIKMSHLTKALEKARPSLSRDELARLKQLYYPFNKKKTTTLEAASADRQSWVLGTSGSLRTALK